MVSTRLTYVCYFFPPDAFFPERTADKDLETEESVSFLLLPSRTPGQTSQDLDSATDCGRAI